MSVNIETVAENVFNLLKGYGYSVKSYDDDGKVVIDPAQATRFAVSDPNILIRIDANEQSIDMSSYKDPDKKLDPMTDRLRKQLKDIAEKYLYNFDFGIFGKRLEPVKSEKIDVERKRKLNMDEDINRIRKLAGLDESDMHPTDDWQDPLEVGQEMFDGVPQVGDEYQGGRVKKVIGLTNDGYASSNPDLTAEYKVIVDHGMGRGGKRDLRQYFFDADGIELGEQHRRGPHRKTRGQMSVSELEDKLEKLKAKLARVNKNPNVGIHNDPEKIKMQISKLAMQIRTRKALGEDRADDAFSATFEPDGGGNVLKQAWRVITGDWFHPAAMNAQAGTEKMRKKGFSDEEIEAVRTALYQGIGDMIVKYGEEEDISKPDDRNFTGWSLNIASRLRQGGELSPEVEKRVLYYLKKNMKERSGEEVMDENMEVMMDMAEGEQLEEGLLNDMFQTIYQATGNVLDKLPVIGKAREKKRIVAHRNNFVEVMTDEKIAEWKEELASTMKSKHPASQKMFNERFENVLKSIEEAKSASNIPAYTNAITRLEHNTSLLRKAIKKSNKGVDQRRRAAKNKMGEDIEVMEGFGYMTGSSKTSYQPLDNVKIVVKHRKPVNEESRGARSRNIHSIYIQRGEEKFKMNENNLKAARAMARHLNMGGEVFDSVGEAINEMAEEQRKLKEFVSYVRRAKLINEENSEYVELARENMNYIKTTLEKLAGAKTYANAVESIDDYRNIEILEDDLDLESKFTETHFDDRVANATKAIGRSIAKRNNYKMAIENAIQNENFDNVKDMLSETDGVVDFATPHAKLSYQVSRLGDAAKNETLRNHLYSISRTLSDGGSLGDFEYKTVKQCLMNASRDQEQPASPENVAESYAKFLETFNIF